MLGTKLLTPPQPPRHGHGQELTHTKLANRQHLCYLPAPEPSWAWLLTDNFESVNSYKQQFPLSEKTLFALGNVSWPHVVEIWAPMFSVPQQAVVLWAISVTSFERFLP